MGRMVSQKADTAGTALHRKRRGAIFNYYMMYMLLSGIMLSSAGITLHLVLRSGAHDDAAEQELRTVVRMERQIRIDEQQADCGVLEGNALTLTLRNGELVIWEAAENVISRTSRMHETVTSLDRFVLARRHRAFILPTSQSLVTFRVVQHVQGYAGSQGQPEGNPTTSLDRPLSTTPYLEILVALESGQQEIAE